MSTVPSEEFQGEEHLSGDQPSGEHLSEEYEPEGEPTLEADPVDKAEQQVEVELGEDEL